MKTLLLITYLFICSMVIGQSSQIIGKSIKIGRLEIAQNDFPDGMMWNQAKKACAGLGKGWRLPTKNEFNLLYKNKDKIGGFAVESNYWSGTETGDYSAWRFSFYDGLAYDWSGAKSNDFRVRAVRSF